MPFARVASGMSTVSPSMRDLARRLLAAGQEALHPDAHGVSLVNDNLRQCITRFAGADGFTSLLRRAVTLTSTQIPPLRDARIDVNGHLEGLDQTFVQDDTMLQQASLAVTAQLLELLVTFIGEPLTRRLVREALPEISPKE